MSKCEQCIIKQFNSLKVLSKEELFRISNCKTTKVIRRGDVIFSEGDKINGVYCVKDGICKLSKLSENGKDQIVKLHFKGDLLGKRTILEDTTTNLTATALSDMEVCFIPKSEIMHDLGKNPDFSIEVLKQMAQDLKDSDNTIVNMAQKSVRRRLADALTYMYDNFGVDEDHYLKVVLSREDYANIVGTATESAIRILSQFKNEGLISTSGKQIKLEDIPGLKRVE